MDRVILPESLKPLTYRLKITPNLDAFTFDVEEEIDISIQQDPSTITQIIANAKDLNVHQAKLSFQTKQTTIQTITYDNENDYVIFHLDNKSLKDVLGLEVNQVFTLSLTLTGELNDKMVGFYRSKYIKDGIEKYAASTQFEPVEARRAFVCWDEPAVKAVFEVTLIVPKHLTALSNMECIEESNLDNDLKVCKFAPSPLMSTYLVAFVIGEYDYVEKVAEETTNKVKVRVYCPVGKKEQGLFSLEVAVKVLPLFEKYFELDYPLNKLDMVAITSFSAGAMENFGLVTYRETALLVDPKNTSSSVKQWVAIVVAHELSHQWFGNTVTMKWWDGLWLNESFATWCEYFAIDNLYPEWKVFEQFVHDDFYRAMTLDGLKSSHPIDVPIRIAAEVDEIFDAISYSKGCCVIRMLINYLGIEPFRKGMVHYLNKYKWSNAETEHLWSCLSEISGKDVSSIMNNWTKCVGYPIVNVEVVSEQQNNNETILKLRQDRFIEASGIDTTDSTIWSIPISYIVCNSNNEIIENQTLMTEKEITIKIPSNYKWFKLNKNQTGFYRVKYNIDNEFYTKLTEPIKNKTLSTIDRMAILEDVTTLAKSNLISTENVLTILTAYTQEDDYTVISTVSNVVSTLFNLLKHEDENVLNKFRKFARELFLEMGKKLGWKVQSEDESHLTQMTRPLVIGSLLKYQDESTIQTALQKFKELQQDANNVIPDLRAITYSAKIKYNNNTQEEEEGYNSVFEIYKKTDLNEERVRVLRCLGATPNESLIKKTLQMVIDGTVNMQDTMYLLMGTSTNPKATLLCWNFLKENIKEIKERYEGGFLLGRLIKLSVEGITDKKLVEEVKEFLEQNKTKSSERSIDQAIEGITLNSKWKENALSSIVNWLNNNVH
ncbi:hypothetical protein ABK040_014577 [Willaertia magna]